MEPIASSHRVTLISLIGLVSNVFKIWNKDWKSLKSITWCKGRVEKTVSTQKSKQKKTYLLYRMQYSTLTREASYIMQTIK